MQQPVFSLIPTLEVHSSLYKKGWGKKKQPKEKLCYSQHTVYFMLDRPERLWLCALELQMG